MHSENVNTETEDAHGEMFQMMLTAMTGQFISSSPLVDYKISYLSQAVSRYHRLVGLVVKASASRAGGPGFESR